MVPAFLDDRAIIGISGPQAREFLQGLVTNDVVTGPVPGQGVYTALLSPQGKILFDFLVAAGDEALLLDVPQRASDALLKKLRAYKLRAKVEIDALPQLGVYAGLPSHPNNRIVAYADRAVSFPDPRLSDLGVRSIGPRVDMPVDLGGSERYHALRLELAVPEGQDFGFEKIFALDAGLEELNAISFKKGCYIGQELTSRMKHRATARKRILPVIAADTLPMVGTPIQRGDVEIGELVAHYGSRGFGLIRLDRLEETHGDIRAGEIGVALKRPPWLVADHGR